MNPIHDNNGNLLAIEMNGSRISAALPRKRMKRSNCGWKATRIWCGS